MCNSCSSRENLDENNPSHQSLKSEIITVNNRLTYSRKMTIVALMVILDTKSCMPKIRQTFFREKKEMRPAECYLLKTLVMSGRCKHKSSFVFTMNKKFACLWIVKRVGS